MKAKSKAAQSVTGKPIDDFQAAFPGSVTSHPGISPGAKTATEQAIVGPGNCRTGNRSLETARLDYRWLLFAAIIVLLNIAVWGLVSRRPRPC